jgi:hypothetical protein
MATVYIQPGTGTGTGTEVDPYYYSELGSASLNDRGAYLFGTVIRPLTLGTSSTSTTKIEGFKAANIYYVASSSSVTLTLNKIDHADTISSQRAQLGIFYFKSNNTHSVTNSSFVIDYSGTDRFVHTAGGTTINSCSFFLKCSSVASNGIQSFPTGPGASTNTIFMSDNADAIDATVINTSNCTNCCVFQMDTGDSSGGTDNIFVDPQFVDSANGDLRLRPSSPCIGAGTAS